MAVVIAIPAAAIVVDVSPDELAIVIATIFDLTAPILIVDVIDVNIPIAAPEIIAVVRHSAPFLLSALLL